MLSRSSFAMRPGQALAYFYFEGRARSALSGQAAHQDEARRIAANVAKLPELLRKD